MTDDAYSVHKHHGPGNTNPEKASPPICLDKLANSVVILIAKKKKKPLTAVVSPSWNNYVSILLGL